MAFIYALIAVGGLFLATCDSGARVFAPAAANDTAPPGRTFKVMTFNIQHGIDGRSKYDLQRAIAVIARIQPDLAGVQEITRNHSMYNCDDQPAVISEGLRHATGRTWHHVYVQEWFVNQDRKCVESGRGDGPNTEGLAFFAPEPLGSVANQSLWNTRIGLATRVSAAGNTSIILTHLANGSRDKDKQDRMKQVLQLLPWAEGQGSPRILMGDMNAFPDAPELEPVLRVYKDAWAEASASGSNRGVADGATRPGRTSRVDYVFFTSDSRLRLESVDVIDTAQLIGVQASDHSPVVASFRRP